MSDFSVIVPIFYGENYISDMIHQIEVCRKHLKKEDNIEVLFVNDSPSAALDLGWKSEIIDIRVINCDRNVGIHGARLKGLALCKGDYILFLDQDDKIKPEYFESQMRNLRVADFVVCRAIHAKRFKYSIHFLFESAVSKEYMLTQGNGIVSPGQVLLRKEAIPSIWKKNPLVHNGADDWFLWICIMSEGKKFALNDEVLYEHVVEGTNASENFLEMTYSEYEMVQIIERGKILSRDELSVLKETVSRLCQQKMQITDRYGKMYFLYYIWMQLCYDNCSITVFMREQGYKTVAIYGDGYLGKLLYKELKKNHINVICFIDRNADYLKEEIPVYKPQECLPDVDVIVITVIQNGKKVEELLKEKSSAKICCLEELLEKIKSQKH